jgi:hypothetical protein
MGGFNSDDYPFINFIKGLYSIQSSSGYGYPAILDANGYPTSAPTQTVFGSVRLPGTAYEGRWVLKWSGTGRVRLDRGAPGFTVHSGAGSVIGSTGFNLDVSGASPRVEFSGATSGIASITVNFPSGAAFSGMSNLVLCRLADEAAVDAGEYFLPEFLDRLRVLNPRVIRPMGWTDPNDNNNVSKFSDRWPLAGLSWSAYGWTPSAWVGTISGTDTYTCAAASDAPGSWTHLERFQGQFTNANTSTTPTINVGSRGAKILVTSFINALSAGNIAANQLATFVYDADLDKVIWQSGGLHRGVPLEVQVELANQVGCDIYPRQSQLVAHCVF